MKRILFKSLSILMAMVMLLTQTQALAATTSKIGLPSIDESLLVLNEDALESAMQELNELESFIASNEGITYNDLLTTGSDLIINVDDASAPLGMDQEGDPPLGIPSFLWGCILGIVGILLVYILTDGDKDETKKALWGMLVWVGVWIILYVGVFSASALWY
jgi:hypothetical protein